MIEQIREEELSARIGLNKDRLTTGDKYQLDALLRSIGSYSWKGDMEGRALLAFMSHYKIDGSIIPCMNELYEVFEEKTCGRLYFVENADLNGLVSEQQLAGHSWLLRGLCEHYECFGDELSLRAVKAVFEGLYLPLKDKIAGYPIERNKSEEGGVSGSHGVLVDGWVLSTDTGTFFMSIDGLSHAYAVTGDERIKDFLDRMLCVFNKIDKVGLRMQTHCTLTAARGMLRLYGLTGDNTYLEGAKAVYDIYVDSGMTYTYENINWWGRHDSWTEPCAIVDSLMVALELYKITGEEHYRQMAARIFANGFATLQRDNGGAGTDTVVTSEGESVLVAKMYEAWFCCTMRLAEGLWYVQKNRELLYCESFGTPKKDARGVYMDGDIVYACVSGEAEKYVEKTVCVDGIKLSPIVKYYKLPKEAIMQSKQQIIFK